MHIEIGTVVKNKRKEKGITQQQLADFIGVSKASVSKWESNQSYPDITLLPLIATYFDISLDDLFNYNTQLSNKQIRQIYQTLQTDIKTKPSDEILGTIQRFIRRYYSNYKFVLHMGLFIINHLDILSNNPNENKEILELAKELFVHVKLNATDSYLQNYATALAGYTLLQLGEGREVLNLLGENISFDYGTEILILHAWQMIGANTKAKEVAQANIYQLSVSMMNGLTNYLRLLVDDPVKLQMTIERGLEFAKVFKLQSYHPILLLNFQLGSAYILAQVGIEEKLLNVLEDFFNLYKKMKFPIKLQGDDYFDSVEPWLDSLDLGTTMPRNMEIGQHEFLEYLLQDPIFESYKNKPEFDELFKQIEGEYKNLKRKEKKDE